MDGDQGDEVKDQGGGDEVKEDEVKEDEDKVMRSRRMRIGTICGSFTCLPWANSQLSW